MLLTKSKNITKNQDLIAKISNWQNNLSKNISDLTYIFDICVNSMESTNFKEEKIAVLIIRDILWALYSPTLENQNFTKIIHFTVSEHEFCDFLSKVLENTNNSYPNFLSIF